VNVPAVVGVNEAKFPLEVTLICGLAGLTGRYMLKVYVVTNAPEEAFASCLAVKGTVTSSGGMD